MNRSSAWLRLGACLTGLSAAAGLRLWRSRRHPTAHAETWKRRRPWFSSCRTVRGRPGRDPPDVEQFLRELETDGLVTLQSADPQA
jgi:hypothetical protein